MIKLDQQNGDDSPQSFSGLFQST